MKSKIKRILLFSILGIIIYLGIGAVLLNYEIIQRLYIFPGWSIKHGNTDEDNSTVSSDGPIIMYENGKVLKYQVLPKDKSFSISKTEIEKNKTVLLKQISRETLQLVTKEMNS